MNTRLKQFLAAENISQSQFADTIKVVRASVSHVLSGRNKPGYDFITAIMSAYPQLNIEWLMLGKGKMYKTLPDTSDISQQPSQQPESDLPLLFDYEDDPQIVYNLPQLPETYESPSPDNSVLSCNSINTSGSIGQHTVKQRKAIKVVVFFDDDTFQEIATTL